MWRNCGRHSQIKNWSFKESLNCIEIFKDYLHMKSLGQLVILGFATLLVRLKKMENFAWFFFAVFSLQSSAVLNIKCHGG